MNNPRRESDALAPAELPDPAELALMQADRTFHRPMPAIFWMAEEFWRLTRLLDKINDASDAALDQSYSDGQGDGYESGYKDGKEASGCAQN